MILLILLAISTCTESRDSCSLQDPRQTRCAFFAYLDCHVSNGVHVQCNQRSNAVVQSRNQINKYVVIVRCACWLGSGPSWVTMQRSNAAVQFTFQQGTGVAMDWYSHGPV